MSYETSEKTVLIVDDDIEQIDILVEILKPLYTVKAVKTGQGALEIATSENPPDLILLDIMMPVMPGYEVCRCLKAERKTRDIPVIFLTVRAELKDTVKGFEFGAVDYIVKPVDPSVLKARIKNQLDLQFALKILEKQNRQLKEDARLKADLELKLRNRLETMVEDRTRSLKLSENRYRRLFEESNDAVFIYGRNVEIIDLNPKACAMLGYERKEILSQRLPSFYPKGEDVTKANAFRTAFDQGDYRFESKFKRSDGTVLDVDISSRIVDKQECIVQCIVRDITYIKSVERKLMKQKNELQQLHRHLYLSRELERTSISRDIHDDLGQSLTALNMDIRWLKKKMSGEQRISKLDSMLEIVSNASNSVKRICSELRPMLIDDFGLSAAVEWIVNEFQKRTRISCRIHIEPEELTLDDIQQIAIFRIIQEAMTNVARHSNATRLVIRLKKTSDKGLLLNVWDDGKGISKKQLESSDSIGILGMRERAQIIGGKLRIFSGYRKGTNVTLRISDGENR